MSVPVARRDPHLRRFPLRSRVVHAAGGPLRLVVPGSSQLLLERSAAAVRAAERGDLPHWADVWPASIALARRLLRGPELRDAHAADLGCGVGVAGIAAGRRGARVSFLDRCEDALRFAAFNATRNGVATHDAVRFDWSRDELPRDVDVLLIADLLYAWRHGRALLRHVEAVVERGGRALIGDPYRPTADDFLESVRARWPASVVEEHGVVDDGTRVPIRVVEVARGLA